MTKHICLYLLLFSLLTACKKGENDPLLSLQSRKSRIAGAWRVSKGKVTVDVFNTSSGYHFDGVYTIDGNTIKGTETTLTAYAQVSGNFVLDMVIDKKGSFSFNENIQASNIQAKGTWNFAGNIGDEKNKESAIFQLESVSNGSSGSHFFNHFSMTFKYRIKELRDKVLVLSSNESVYVNTKGDTQKIAAEFTFVQ